MVYTYGEARVREMMFEMGGGDGGGDGGSDGSIPTCRNIDAHHKP